MRNCFAGLTPLDDPVGSYACRLQFDHAATVSPARPDHEGVKQCRGCCGNLVDGLFIRLAIHGRRLSVAADLANELQRGLADVILGGFGCCSPKLTDAAAHDRLQQCLSMVAALTATLGPVDGGGWPRYRAI